MFNSSSDARLLVMLSCLATVLVGCSGKEFSMRSNYAPQYRRHIEELSVMCVENSNLDEMLAESLTQKGVSAIADCDTTDSGRFLLYLEKGSKTTLHQDAGEMLPMWMAYATAKPTIDMRTGHTIISRRQQAMANYAVYGVIGSRKEKNIDYLIVIGVIVDTQSGLEIWRGKFVDKGIYSGKKLMDYYADRISKMLAQDDMLVSVP